MKQRILCRLGKHKWHQQHTEEDNQSYLACQYCRAVDIGPVGTYREGAVPPGALGL